MDILSIAIAVFTFLEITNVIMLYFTPGTKLGNGVGVFNAFEKSKAAPEVHALVRYLVNWVAGTKLIFIVLLVVIILTGSHLTKLLSTAALILSIATYFWRLAPLIRKMDEAGSITPKGYSRTLNVMIICFIAVFVFALIASFFVARP